MEKISRRKARENVFFTLFAASFGAPLPETRDTFKEEAPEYRVDRYGEQLLTTTEAHMDDIDAKIQAKLKGWKVERLSRTSLALLRLAVAEMCYGEEEDMDSIVINETVELAKKYGEEQDYQFINGVLGAISRDKTGQGI